MRRWDRRSGFVVCQTADRVETPRPSGRLASLSVPYLRHRFVMKFRGPKTLGNRPQKAMVCPTSARIVLLAVALAAVALFAQDPVFRADVSLVRVDAQVTRAHEIVEGLQKDDFLILDNGKPQSILYCTQDEEPLDLLLLFDTSGSMLPSMRRLAASAHTALSELRKGDRVAVANFNTTASLIAPFNGDLQEAEEAVGRIVDVRFGGGTHILKAVEDGAKYFAQHGDPHRRHAILIFTDNFGQSSASEKEVVKRMWESDVLLCGLIVRTGEAGGFPGMASEDMLSAAQKTGGETVNADDPGHTFREMLRRMRKRYSIYYAMPADKPGVARQVTVELAAGAKGRYPGAEVLARKGYMIPASHK
jgi:VWFA-related protein